MEDRKWITAFRWLAFIPGAFIAGLLSYLLIFYSNKLSMRMMGIDTEGFINTTILVALSGAAQGTSFVYAGARIAPSNRKAVSYGLAVFAILIAGFMAFPAIAQQNWSALVGCIAMAGGAGTLIYLIADKQLDIDTHKLF